MTILGNRFALNARQRLGAKLVRQIGDVSFGADGICLDRLLGLNSAAGCAT